MDTFLQRFAGKIKGVIHGFDRMGASAFRCLPPGGLAPPGAEFLLRPREGAGSNETQMRPDRIVFKGCIRPLMYAEGAMGFFRSHGVRNKDFKAWAIERSAALVAAADAYARSHCGRKVEPIASCHERKETLAHNRQRELGVQQGLIGVWWCIEACSTYRARYDAQAGFPQLRADYGRCKHLYFYFDHAQYGFMSVRLQTWFPYSIQIALNGREWLRRSLGQEKIDFVLHGNKFLHIADYRRAQKHLAAQTDARWVQLLTDFLPQVFPSMAATLGPHLSYYWTLWQSEWATDYVFDTPAALNPLLDSLLRHAVITGTCDRVLRYMGRPVDANGQPHPRANPEVLTRANIWHEGIRIRHWVDKNSVKLYNEHNVLRAEMTMNNPGMFRVYRHPESQAHSGPKRRMALRKGLADIAVRTQVAADINHRFMEHMATLRDDTPLRDVLKEPTLPSTHNGRPVRALDITGKDRELLLAIADPQYVVCGITNRRLQGALRTLPWAKGGTDKQLSARISRHLRLLRAHGLIRKMPNQRKYFLTEKGRTLTTALNAMLAASTQQLMEKTA